MWLRSPPVGPDPGRWSHVVPYILRWLKAVRFALWDYLWCIGWYVGLRRAYKSRVLDMCRATAWRDSKGKSWPPMVGASTAPPLFLIGDTHERLRLSALCSLVHLVRRPAGRMDGDAAPGRQPADR
nr:MAG TPA: hypothetical protein [Caudoviricetes sp.]